MKLREALIQQAPSLALQRAAADEIAKQDALIELMLEALDSCYPGDYSTGHVIPPYFDESAVESAIAAANNHMESK